MYNEIHENKINPLAFFLTCCMGFVSLHYRGSRGGVTIQMGCSYVYFHCPSAANDSGAGIFLRRLSATLWRAIHPPVLLDLDGLDPYNLVFGWLFSGLPRSIYLLNRLRVRLVLMTRLRWA